MGPSTDSRSGNQTISPPRRTLTAPEKNAKAIKRLSLLFISRPTSGTTTADAERRKRGRGRGDCVPRDKGGKEGMVGGQPYAYSGFPIKVTGQPGPPRCQRSRVGWGVEEEEGRGNWGVYVPQVCGDKDALFFPTRTMASGLQHRLLECHEHAVH